MEETEYTESPLHEIEWDEDKTLSYEDEVRMFKYSIAEHNYECKVFGRTNNREGEILWR
jgi:hypothetical protein